MSDNQPDIDHPAREEHPAKWQQSGENCPSGNIYDTLGGINGTYPLQGISRTTGIALLERAAHAARELGPLPPRVDGCLGTLALIALRMMTRPLPDSGDDLAMLAKAVRE